MVSLLPLPLFPLSLSLVLPLSGAPLCVYTSLVLRGNDTADVERGRIYSRADAYPHNEDGAGESSGGFGFLKHVESLLKGHYMGNAEKCSPRQRNFRLDASSLFRPDADNLLGHTANSVSDTKRVKLSSSLKKCPVAGRQNLRNTSCRSFCAWKSRIA